MITNRTQSLQHTEWTDHYIIKNQTKCITIPSSMKNTKVTIKRNGKYEHRRISVSADTKRNH
jgi:hypothetical protein